jgi:hypothetical protein
VTEALALLDRALDFLNAADVASLPAQVQADVLRRLERAESKHTAVRARVLSTFSSQDGHYQDGAQTARTWLVWHTRVSRGAAAGAVGWSKRLRAHPVIESALAAGDVSASWAKRMCEWSDRLPESVRDEADAILHDAAITAADLRSLAALAEELAARFAGPSQDDGFEDRYVRLGVTYQGAGRVEGDLTPSCTAALSAVLETLGKKVGPEDTRTAHQRRHDALEEACKRLAASGMLPGRAGQPTRVHVHMSLAQLRKLPGASAAEAAWAAARVSQPGWLSGPEADAVACDATVVPIVTGAVDWAALDHLTESYLATHRQQPGTPAMPTAAAGLTDGQAGQASGSTGLGESSGPADARAGGAKDRRAGALAVGRSGAPAGESSGPAVGRPGAVAGGKPGGAADRRAGGPAGGCGCTCGRCDCHTVPGEGGHRHPAPEPLTPATRQRLRRALLALATEALSGPAGLAARLRAGLDDAPLTSTSLPLDIGPATETIPAHLRRAVATRHRHCAFPGCDHPASVCDIHHVIPRSRGGPTALANLVPLCAFHHLIVIHRWGWSLRLNADGTTTATSPDEARTLHSHSLGSAAA